jgi:hypothetical protein
MKALLLAGILTFTAAGPAIAGEAPAAEPAEASIPFVNHNGIRDWRDDGRDGIYVQANGGQWYHGTFMGPCTDLPFANTIGFETRGIDTLDRFGAVIVRGTRCQLNSLVKSTAPPKKDDKRKRTIEKTGAADAPTA